MIGVGTNGKVSDATTAVAIFLSGLLGHIISSRMVGPESTPKKNREEVCEKSVTHEHSDARTALLYKSVCLNMTSAYGSTTMTRLWLST